LREAVQRRCIELGAASQPSAAPPVPRPPSTTHDAAPQRRRSQLSPVQAHGAPPLRCSVALLPLPFFVVARGPVALTIELTIDIDPVTRQAMPALLARIRDMPSLGQPPSRLSPVLRPLSRPLSSVYPPVCLFVCHSACPSVYPLPPPTPTPKTTLQRLVINTNHRLLDCLTAPRTAPPLLFGRRSHPRPPRLHASTHAESAPPLRDTATVPARATIALLSPRPALPSQTCHACSPPCPVLPCPVPLAYSRHSLL
jgi:hypothetical protein